MRKKKIWPAVLITLLLCTIVFGVFHYLKIKAKDEEIAVLEAQKADVKCYAFARNITANSTITASDLKEIDIKDLSKASGMYLTSSGSWTDKDGVQHKYVGHYVSTTDANGKVSTTTKKELIDDAIIGRMVKFNVTNNTPILDSFLFPKDDEPAIDERIEEFNYLLLPSNLVNDEYVDIRLKFPTGEDFIVLAGKKVESMAGDNTIFLRLNEAEIMQMGSATIEAYMENGAQLYAIKYVESATQLFDDVIQDYVAKYEYGLDKAIRAAKIVEARRMLALQSGDAYTTYEDNHIRYITQDAFDALDDSQKETIIAKAIVDEDEISNAVIAGYAGIKESYVKEIREAKEVLEGDGKADASKKKEAEATLNTYSTMQVKVRTALQNTYAVKENVLKAIQANPNLVQTVKDYFAELVYSNPRIDKLKELEAELLTAPDFSYDTSARTKAKIQSEIDALKSARESSVASGFSTAAQEQRARRVAYLESLVK